MNACFGKDGVFSELKRMRDTHVKRFEAFFLGLSCMLALCGYIFLGFGIRFLNSTEFSKSKFGFEKLKGTLLLCLISFFYFVNTIASTGIVLSMTRAIKPFLIVLYAVVLLAFGALPFLGYGARIQNFLRILHLFNKLNLIYFTLTKQLLKQALNIVD